LNRYLLDANVISEVRKLKPHGAVVEWLSGLASEQMFLSAVTLGEMQSGIERTKRQDGKKAQEIEAWVNQLAGSCAVIGHGCGVLPRVGPHKRRKSGAVGRGRNDRSYGTGSRSDRGDSKRTRFSSLPREGVQSV